MNFGGDTVQSITAGIVGRITILIPDGQMNWQFESTPPRDVMLMESDCPGFI